MAGYSKAKLNTGNQAPKSQKDPKGKDKSSNKNDSVKEYEDKPKEE